MILKDVILHLDKLFKVNLAASWDKSGLQVGNLDSDIRGALITVDVTDEVIRKAKESNSGLIISHHPLIFSPLNSIVSDSSTGNKILELIENKISLYAAHTNYDIMSGGLNDYLAKKLELKNVIVIEPLDEQWYKFVIFVPPEAENKVRDAIGQKGGGIWGKYSDCTFNINGTGTFKPLEGSNPYSGKVGELSTVNEIRIECIVSESNLPSLVKSALESHPYEEPAYDIYKIENKFTSAGFGRIGELKESMIAADFFTVLKDKFHLKNFRWRINPVEDKNLENIMVKKIAVINGSANSLSQRISISDYDCDLVIVGELKYQNSMEIVENGKILVELGHYESEKLAIKDIYERLAEYF
ncbi:MAG: Nif3-like dinuclear metal center hexameric protein, partial [Actinobacteria bacterium]|nr:Nif3-like dinuclear metal center hexameric protein [Actinomycetota bacterium]